MSKLTSWSVTRNVALLASISLLAACSSDKKDSNANPQNAGGAGGGGGAGGAGTSDAKADWTRPAYDLASTYWNQAETKISVESAATLDKAWEWNGGDGANVTSTPVISGGKVYFAGTGTYCLDLATGDQVWKNADVSAFSSLTLEDGVLYVHDNLGIVRALKAEDGSEIWNHPAETDGLIGFSSATVTKDLVLIGSSGLEEVAQKKAGETWQSHGFVLALDKKTGEKVWKKFNVEPGGASAGVGIWSTISVDEAGGYAVAGTGNTYFGTASENADAFLAIPLKDGGDYLWKPQILKVDVFPTGGGPDGDFGANPVLAEVDGRKIALGGAKMGDVWSVDRKDGSIIAQRNIGPSSSFKGGIFVNSAWDGKSYLVACNGATADDPGSEPGGATPSVLFALDPLTLDVKWKRQMGGTVWGPITVANGVGFLGKDKTLQAFNTETGEVIKEYPTEASIATAPAVSNGYVVFGSGMSWIGSTAGTKYYALKVQ